MSRDDAVVAIGGRFYDGRWPGFSKRGVARCGRRQMKSFVYSVMAAVKRSTSFLRTVGPKAARLGLAEELGVAECAAASAGSPQGRGLTIVYLMRAP